MKEEDQNMNLLVKKKLQKNIKFFFTSKIIGIKMDRGIVWESDVRNIPFCVTSKCYMNFDLLSFSFIYEEAMQEGFSLKNNPFNRFERRKMQSEINMEKYLVWEKIEELKILYERMENVCKMFPQLEKIFHVQNKESMRLFELAAKFMQLNDVKFVSDE